MCERSRPGHTPKADIEILMRPHILTILASAVLALEGLVVLGLAIGEIGGVLAGASAELPTAIALVVLTVIFGVGLLALAVGVWRRATWARSGGIVAQVLIFALGLGDNDIRGGLPGLVVMIPAVIGFVLVLLASRLVPADRDGGDED